MAPPVIGTPISARRPARLANPGIFESIVVEMGVNYCHRMIRIVVC